MRLGRELVVAGKCIAIVTTALVLGGEPAFTQGWQETRAPSNYWTAVACSADGLKLIAATAGAIGEPYGYGRIYLSTNAGMTWELSSAPTQWWASVASSADGQVLVAAAHMEGPLAAGSLFVSTNAGLTWSGGERYSGFWRSVASSANGSILAAVASINAAPGGPQGQIAVSTNSGLVWVSANVPDVAWAAVASSADGTRLVAVADTIYTSTNSGASWTVTGAPKQTWSSVASSADGTQLVAVSLYAADSTGTICISTNAGVTWSVTSAPVRNWQSVACSANGTRLVAVADGTLAIYRSVDGGNTWTRALASPQAWSSVASTAHGGKLFATSAPGSIHSFKLTPGTMLWSLPIVSSSPAIGRDATLYFTGWGIRGGLFAVTAGGVVRWEYPIYNGTTPAVDNDGTVYVGSEELRLYAIRPDGTLKWTFQTGDAVRSPPAFGADQTIYLLSRDGLCYALNPDGTKKWEYRVGDIHESSPVVGPDGTVYCGTFDSKQLVAINPDGSLRWRFSAAWAPNAGPAIGPENNIYFGTWGLNGSGAIYAVSPDGREQWSFGTGFQSSVVFGTDGTLYTVALQPTTLTAIDPSDRTVLWSRGGGEGALIVTAPAVAADGVIYYGSQDLYGRSAVYAIHPNGATNWICPISTQRIQSPSIGSDGTVYVGSDNGFFAIQGSAPLARSPWPKLAQNVRNTGRDASPRLRAPSYSAECVTVEVLADPRCSCTVQVSSNLIQWASLTNFVAETNRTRFTESPSAAAAQRFYRVISSP